MKSLVQTMEDADAVTVSPKGEVSFKLGDYLADVVPDLTTTGAQEHKLRHVSFVKKFRNAVWADDKVIAVVQDFPYVIYGCLFSVVLLSAY